MKMTFRWYGPQDDKITLEDISQIPGMTGVVACMMDIPVGEVWPRERIDALKADCNAYGLEMDVIESVNVHDDIKVGAPRRDQWIENYKITIENLGRAGVKCICYNFMPVFDWVKSDLDYRLPDGSSTLAFIGSDIPEDVNNLLDRYKNGASDYELPGWEPERLAKLEELFELYKDVDDVKLRENLAYFLEAIIPTCEKCCVKMAIHPDDPPYSMFGLPRIISSREDLDWLCTTVDSPCNCLTLCCGSIAETPDNDLYSILDEFAKRDRIAFAHVRNIKYLSEDGSASKDFYESPHLSKCGSLDLWRIMKILCDNNYNGYVRPDHGRMIWGESGRPGYGLYDRALGVAYINGLWEAIVKDSK
ncbi:MAG: mannonate dehydratase [Eggerthellaceae bacterium]|nr:mannonate dehydratase [Eggerthellaceae bacterium]